MARIVQLSPEISMELLGFMPRRYCIGLLTDEDLIAACEVADSRGGEVIIGSYPVRGQSSLILKGIVVFDHVIMSNVPHPQSMRWLREMCNAIDARTCMHLFARDKKRPVDPVKPWMLKPRPVRGKQLSKAIQA